jgi:bifunctional pyridoxal-dependent enzyme with beta-cystathionase and maltose regulon repressor activities
VLTFADMDIALPNNFKQELIKKIVLTNNFTYKYLPKEYFEAIQNWYTHRHIRSPQIKIYPANIVESPSILSIIYLTIQNFTK